MNLKFFLKISTVPASLILFYIVFFSPIIHEGLIIAGGDTLIYYFPALTQPWSIWSDMLMAGYPSFADSQTMTWYPLCHIHLPFNLFVVAAYIIAAYGAYGFSRFLTNSSFAGLVSAAVYSLGGFMMAHLGHTTIIHVAAWLPLILLAILTLSKRFDMVWLAIGAAAICCSFLGGHPQIFVYVMALASLYAAFLLIENWRVRRTLPFKTGFCFLLMIVLGLSLCAIQILPLLEVGQLSLRKKMTFQDFSSFEFPISQWPIVVFPNIFGTISRYWPSYFGGGAGLTEVSCYFGLSSIPLVLVALSTRERRAEAMFWTIAALLAALYALGDQTPIGSIAYHLPVLGKFRAQARSVVVLTFSMSVLAGLGASKIEFASIGYRTLSKVFVAFAWIGAAILVATGLAYPRIQEMAHRAGTALPPLLLNPAILLPVGCACFMAIAAFALRRKPNMFTRGAVLIAVTIDLSGFSWFYAWRDNAIAPPNATEAAWLEVQSDLRDGGRLLSTGGVFGSLSPAMPNLNALYGLPSASGYGPLSLARYVEATNMKPYGGLDLPVGSPLAALLDIKWVVASSPVEGQESALMLGSTCGQAVKGPLTAVLPQDIKATRIEVVSSLGCSLNLRNGQNVLDISMTDTSGRLLPALNVEAGRDTSEWSIDNPVTSSATKHSRAKIYKTMPTGPFDAYQFVTSLPISETYNGATNIHSLNIALAPADVVINLYNLTLIDDTTGTRYPVPIWRFRYGDKHLWASPLKTASGSELFRYIGPRPGEAWLVTSVSQETAAVTMTALEGGRLPNGSLFLPAELALLEEAKPEALYGKLGGGRVQTIEHNPGRWVFAVDSNGPGYLVVSQTDYPGWSASVNGRIQKIYKTDHAFQGLEVPDGRSEVTLSFSSQTLETGKMISAFSGAIVLALLIFGCITRFRARSPMAVTTAKR